MFKKASQMKLRFDTKKGQITVEDLWDLPLTSQSNVSLDGIAIAVNKELQASKENSFVAIKSTVNTTLEIKLEILKEVIADRIAQNESDKTSADRKQRKEKIMQIIATKEDQALADKPVEELEKMLLEEA